MLVMYAHEHSNIPSFELVHGIVQTGKKAIGSDLRAIYLPKVQNNAVCCCHTFFWCLNSATCKGDLITEKLTRTHDAAGDNSRHGNYVFGGTLPIELNVT